MSALYGWVKSIVFYLVFMAAFYQILPNQSYRKYIRYFTGILLIMIAVSPISSLLSLDQWLEKSFDRFASQYEREDYQIQYEVLDQTMNEAVEQAYIQSMEENAETLCEAHELYVTDFSVSLDEDLNIVSLRLSATFKKYGFGAQPVEKIQIGEDEEPGNHAMEEILKGELAGYYGISESVIDVEVLE